MADCGWSVKKICDVLRESMLFGNLDQEFYRAYCSQSELTLFWKGDIIAQEGDLCPGVIILIEGQASIQKTSPNGDYSTLALLQAGASFGDDLLFGKKRHYQVSLEAASNGKYLLFRREQLFNMIRQSPQLLSNFLNTLSDKVQQQERRINLLSQRSLRLKISAYLMGLLKDQLDESGRTLKEELKIVSTPAVEFPISKEMVARLLAMPRPSLSRELISMEKDGLIRVSGRVIWLRDLKQLSAGEYTII